jgi:putative hydroxymethylpyrimidine transport system substrate-binding protein
MRICGFRFLLLSLFTLVATSTNPDECGADELTCSSSHHLRIGLEWFTNPDHLPLIVAQKANLFADFGLTVELVEPVDHWEAEEEIIQGRLDVAVTEPLHLAQDAAKGKPVLGFSRFLHTDGGVMYRTDSNITRPKDMCGARISYPGSPGPGGPAIVDTMVKSDGGGDCKKSYGKYNGGFFHTNALQENKADVATLIFWNFEIPEARARGLNVDLFSLKDWGVPDFCQLVLFTTPDTFRQKEAVLRKLVLAMRRATGIIHQNPQLARQYYDEYVNATDEDPTSLAIRHATMTATLPAFPNDNSMSAEYYQNLMDWLVDTNQVNATLAANAPAYWTNKVAI